MTAAVQDWLSEPKSSPVKGSKYSPKPPREICSSEVCRSRSALSGSPTRIKAHHKSQLKTGHTGPRQYLRGWNSGSLGLVLGGSGQRRPEPPAKSGESRTVRRVSRWSGFLVSAMSGAKPPTVRAGSGFLARQIVIQAELELGVPPLLQTLPAA